jgi:hypothetical protein
MDYIPQAHDTFFVWQSDFYSRREEKMSSFQINEEKLKPLTAAKSKYELAYKRASNPDAANRADRVERDEREAEYKAAIRLFVNENIRYNSRVGDYDRKYLMLTVPDTTSTPAPVPTTHPVLRIDFSEPSRHTVHILDEAKSSRRKPEGVKECEVWYRVADEEPTHFADLHYAGSTSNGKMLIEFDVPQRGKKVWYNARWINTRGEKGPWGEFENAFIA